MKTEKDSRPLSPHLQVYKWETHMAMSILHRATGVASALGLVMLSIWLAFASGGDRGWQMASAFFGNFFVSTILFLWSGALIYHFCNGIRHLTWDLGKGLSKEEGRRSALYVQIATVVLTLLLWIGIWA